MNKLVFWLVGIMVLSLIGAGVTFASTDGFKEQDVIEVNQEEVFTIDEVTKINISSISEDINFILVDGNEVKVHYYGTIRCFSCESDKKLSGNKTDDTINIDVNGKFIGFIYSFVNLKLDVYLPRTYANTLNIHTVSGDTSLEEMKFNELTFRTTSGDIDLTLIEMNQGRFTSVSGKIDGKKITGDIDFKTTSGDVSIQNFSGNFKGSSVSGDLEIQNIASNFQMDFNTTSGDVEFDLNSDEEFSLEFNTTSGDLSNAFDMTIPSGTKNSKYHFSGYVGSTTNKINVGSVSGDLKIK